MSGRAWLAASLALAGCGDNTVRTPGGSPGSRADARPARVPDDAVRLADDDACFCPVMVRVPDGFVAASTCGGKVMVNRLDSSGAPTSPVEALSEGGCPAIAKSDEIISVAWMSADSIQLARFDDGGSLIGDPVAVVRPDDAYVVNVSVAADTNGHALIWAEASSAVDQRIQFAGLDGDGTLVDGPRTLAAAELRPDGPAVARASGGFVAVWYHPETIQMQHLAPDGSELGESTTEEANPPNAEVEGDLVNAVFAPLRLVSDETKVVVAWPFSRSQVRIHEASAAAPTLDSGETTILPTNLHRVPSIATAVSPDGYLVVWGSGGPDPELPNSDDLIIQWSHLDAGGQTVGPLGFVLADVVQDRHAIAVAHGDAGYVLVFATWDGGLFALPLPS